MIKRSVIIIGILVALLMLTACWPIVPDDASADAAACGLPCDPDFSLDCPSGFACVSGVCLNSTVCDSCGKTCEAATDCPTNWFCGQDPDAPGASPKYCWPSHSTLNPPPEGKFACTQITENYCGKPCFSDWVTEDGNQKFVYEPDLGGYVCFNNVLISMDRELCSTCGKDCTSDTDCASGVACTQFTTHTGALHGYCWDDDLCTSTPWLLPVTPLVPVALPTPTTTPVPFIPPDQPQPDPPLPACGDGICDPASENRDLCAADCPCVDDGVCGLGETAQCGDCITSQPSDTGGQSTGGETTGGTCACEVVCVETDRLGNCTLREPRDCNGNRC